jgi:hypothetical protein
MTIDTVERYQGSQRKYIVYGFTVQKYYQLNFLTNNVFEDKIDGSIVDRKLNVAMTRAEEHLVMFGNAELPEGGILLDNGMVAIRRKKMPDKGQRKACGCMVSKDIGQYNTCLHQCEYCYATASKEIAQRNWSLHQANPQGETISGK